MTEKKSQILIIAVIVIAVLEAANLALSLRPASPTPEQKSVSIDETQTPLPASEPTPEPEPELSSQLPSVSTSTSESVPYVAPIKHRIVGLWEVLPPKEVTSEFDSYYDFQTDGTLIQKWYIHDTGEWKSSLYNYSFSTWKDTEVIEGGFLPNDEHFTTKFYEKDGLEYLEILIVGHTTAWIKVVRSDQKED